MDGRRFGRLGGVSDGPPITAYLEQAVIERERATWPYVDLFRGDPRRAHEELIHALRCLSAFRSTRTYVSSTTRQPAR